MTELPIFACTKSPEIAICGDKCGVRDPDRNKNARAVAQSLVCDLQRPGTAHSAGVPILQLGMSDIWQVCLSERTWRGGSNESKPRLTALAIVEPILSNARDEVGDRWRRARVRQAVPLQRNSLVVFGRSRFVPNEGGHR